MIVINQIKAEVDRENFNDARRTDAIIKKDIAKKLKLKSVSDVPGYKIIKKSLDARKKPKLFYIYSVLVDIKMPSKADRKFVSEYNEEKYAFPYSAENGSASYRPVIVGFGPGGTFSALLLARAGFKPIVLERGRDADSRSRDVECYWNGGELKYNSNVQFGEGGAGTFSDGKLYTGIGKAGGRVDFVSVYEHPVISPFSVFTESNKELNLTSPPRLMISFLIFLTTSHNISVPI